VLRLEALEALITKQLKYVGSYYPVSSLIRTRKFLNRGFSCSAGEYLKMAYQVSKLDLNDIEVLKEQLIGVDAALFSRIIEMLEQEKDKDPSFIVSYEKIVELVEDVF